MEVLDAVESEIIILHRSKDAGAHPYAVETVLREPLLAQIAMTGLAANALSVNAQLVLPQEFNGLVYGKNLGVTFYNGSIDIAQSLSICSPYAGRHVVISNGRYVNTLRRDTLRHIAAIHKSDITLIHCNPDLAAGNEKLLRTPCRTLAGIRRIYSPQVRISPPPSDWPCYVVIRPDLLYKSKCKLPLTFKEFISQFKDADIRSFNIGTQILDLNLAEDMHAFMSGQLAGAKQQCNSILPQSCRAIGPVLVGSNVKIDHNVTILGPSIICSDVTLGRSSVIDRSIIMANNSIKPNEIVRNKFMFDSCRISTVSAGSRRPLADSYRRWNWYSYPGIFKRFSDIVASFIVLLLFAPVIAIIAMLVKLTSKGPAFYGDKRQGLHGKEFRCFKFRSMIAGADRLQQKLRALNEVDGPQFKMEDDPRVTGIGRFLRNTYLDEIPQFFNVLIGNMSIVGPRPSPEAENSLCASWRDARLSVRPGITGLWQVSRTRKPGSDFQEWVYFDKIYVSRLSLRLDIEVCWKTGVYILKAFLKQF